MFCLKSKENDKLLPFRIIFILNGSSSDFFYTTYIVKYFKSFKMAFDSVLLKYFKDQLFRYMYLSFLYIFKEVGS